MKLVIRIIKGEGQNNLVLSHSKQAGGRTVTQVCLWQEHSKSTASILYIYGFMCLHKIYKTQNKFYIHTYETGLINLIWLSQVFEIFKINQCMDNLLLWKPSLTSKLCVNYLDYLVS